jgi:hypothetical protein
LSVVYNSEHTQRGILLVLSAYQTRESVGVAVAIELICHVAGFFAFEIVEICVVVISPYVQRGQFMMFFLRLTSYVVSCGASDIVKY